MSFWATSDGKSAQQTEGKFEMGGGDLAPIPDGTSVLAIAEEAKNDEHQGAQFIKVKWRVSKPAATRGYSSGAATAAKLEPVGETDTWEEF